MVHALAAGQAAHSGLLQAIMSRGEKHASICRGVVVVDSQYLD